MTSKLQSSERTQASLDLLYSISRELAAQLDLKVLLQKILQLTSEKVGAFSGSIMVLDESGTPTSGAVAYDGNVHDRTADELLDTFEEGLAGWVAKNKQSALIINTLEDPRWLKKDSEEDRGIARSAISVPLQSHERYVGILTLVQPEAEQFNNDDLILLSSIADQAGIAVENARLYEESQRQMKATIALAETARQVSSSLDLNEVLQRILAQTIHSLEVDAASLALFDTESGKLEFKLAKGGAAEAIIGMKMLPGEGIAGWVFQFGEPLVVRQASEDPRFDSSIDEQLGFKTRSIACVPIKVKSATIGVLEAINVQGDVLDEGQLELFMGIGGLAGTAIEHARLFAETQKARRLYAGLFGESIDPVLITTPMGKISDANQRAQSFLGYTLSTLLGSSIFQVHEPEIKFDEEELQKMTAGKLRSYTGSALHYDGRKLPIQVQVQLIQVDDAPILQWIFRDISEKLALDELRSDLTSMIFHDLRSPLGNVISSLEVMRVSIADDDAGLLEVLSVAQRSSRRLSRLVDSLLDLGLLEEGKEVLFKVEISLEKLLREALEEVRPIADAKGHSLTLQLPQEELPMLMCDADMMRRVVINLLENAVKYTTGAGNVILSVLKEENRVRISVEDNGLGIALENQERVFEKFSRLDPKGRRKGLGLGLAFCRLAVGAHEGEIGVESELGKGSRFFFTLPV
jgi:PAS domain S-box-containing protein